LTEAVSVDYVIAMTEAAIRVLLIEDDPGYGRLVREMLGAAGGAAFQVEFARQLADGCALLSRTKVDVILLDLGLPDSTGLETFDRVRAEAPGVPIVVLSHVDDEAVAIQAARHGAQDYLVKGYMDAHALGRAVRYAVERARSEAALSESQRALSTLMNNLPGMAYRCKNTRQWTMEFVSSGCFELTGYQPEELIADAEISFGELVHPDDAAVGWEEIQESLQENRAFQLNYRIITKGGEERWVWEQGAGIRDTRGRRRSARRRASCAAAGTTPISTVRCGRRSGAAMCGAAASSTSARTERSTARTRRFPQFATNWARSSASSRWAVT
jgi:PAS domain S-box-containing protein